ncbi:hypothetical protein EMCRGX_G021227 [Ephydatia muelleri]|eukprot:Em0016g1090a
MTDLERLSRVEKRAKEAELTLEQLKKYVEILKNNSDQSTIGSAKTEIQHLSEENRKLEKEIEKLRETLVTLEIKNGVAQVPHPSAVKTIAVMREDEVAQATPLGAVAQQTALPLPAKENVQVARSQDHVSNSEENTKKKGSKETITQEKKKDVVSESKPKKKSDDSAAKKAGDEESNDETVDVSKLDLRIGRILSANRHPDADSLYVEEVDVGEPKARTVVSGLVKHVPLEEMQNRMVVLLCNLKPAKMRGVTSEAMVMCGSSPEKVEIIDPPPGSLPGDRVTFKGYSGAPDTQLNPKKKIFEQVQPELRVSEEGVACYCGVPFTVEGKGVCQVASMKNSAIK